METLGEYDRLLRYILAASSTSGIRLALARYEHGEVARRTRAAAIAAVRASGSDVAEVDFSDAADDVDIGARLRAANAKAPIVFAFGLEGLLLEFGVEPRATDAIAKFNFDRDLLPDRMQGVLVLWLSYRATRAFATFARDTFDVVSASFDFPEMLESQGESGDEFVTMDSLPEWAPLAPLARVPELEERVRLLESLFADAEPGSASAADLAVSLGKLESTLGHAENALLWFDRAAETFERRGDTGRAVNIRRWRVGTFARLGRFELAERELVVARELAGRSGDPEVEFEVQLSEAELEHLRGNLARAREILENILSETSNALLRAMAMSRLAGIQVLAGEADAALGTLNELVTRYGVLGKPWDRARAAKMRAAALAAKHQYDEALQTLREDVLPAFQQLGDYSELARTMSFIVAILGMRGETEQAIALLSEQVLPLFEQLNDTSEHARHREILATLQAELGQDPTESSTH
jgi:tetratricopeptide (TPR) repeat protein